MCALTRVTWAAVFLIQSVAGQSRTETLTVTATGSGTIAAETLAPSSLSPIPSSPAPPTPAPEPPRYELVLVNPISGETSTTSIAVDEGMPFPTVLLRVLVWYPPGSQQCLDMISDTAPSDVAPSDVAPSDSAPADLASDGDTPSPDRTPTSSVDTWCGPTAVRLPRGTVFTLILTGSGFTGSQPLQNSITRIAFTGYDAVLQKYSTCTVETVVDGASDVALEGLTGVTGSGQLSISVFVEGTELSLRRSARVASLPSTVSLSGGTFATGSFTAHVGLSFDVAIILDTTPVFGTYVVTSSGTVLSGTTSLSVDSVPAQTLPILSVSFEEAGTFVVVFSFIRSDGVVLSVNSTADVTHPPPARFMASRAVRCLVKYPLLTQPEYYMYATEQMTRLTKFRTNVTISMSQANPDFMYDDPDAGSRYRLNSWPSLQGGNSGNVHVVEAVDGVVRMTGLWIDRPGDYEVSASFVHLGVTYRATESFRCFDLPAYDKPAAAEVNSRLTLYFRGSLAFGQAGTLILSGSPTCTGHNLTSSIRFPSEPTNPDPIFNSVEEALAYGVAGELNPYYYQQRLQLISWLFFIDVYPYDSSQTGHICLALDSVPEWWVPLWAYYELRHTEPVPVVKRFPVEPAGTCGKLSARQAKEFQTAEGELQWADVTEGRRYGCKLVPPVDGAVPPCACPVRYVCSDYIAHQAKLSINVGICECCASWFLALNWATGAALFLGIGYFILVMM